MEHFQHVKSAEEVWDSSSQSVPRNADPIPKKQKVTHSPSFMDDTDTGDTGTEKVEIGVCFQGWVKILKVMVIFFIIY